MFFVEMTKTYRELDVVVREYVAQGLPGEGASWLSRRSS